MSEASSSFSSVNSSLKRRRSRQPSETSSVPSDLLEMSDPELLQELPNRIGVNVDPVQQTELRRRYGELIEECQTYRDKDEIEGDLEKRLAENISRGHDLFRQIRGEQRSSNVEYQQQYHHQNVIKTWGPGDMYMAFLHTKMCSSTIRAKTEKIGNSTSGFTIDAFIAALLDKGCEDALDHDSRPRPFVKYCMDLLPRMQRKFVSVTSLAGSFDAKNGTAPPGFKKKKQRANWREDEDDGPVCATIHHEVTISERDRKRKEDESPEAQSQELLLLLKNGYRDTQAAKNFFEFVMSKDSFASFVENCFYVSFLARDGYITLTGTARPGKVPSNSDLSLLPAIPPKKHSKSSKEQSEDPSDGERKQYIISFNAKTFKKLLKAAAKGAGGTSKKTSGATDTSDDAETKKPNNKKTETKAAAAAVESKKYEPKKAENKRNPTKKAEAKIMEMKRVPVKRSPRQERAKRQKR